MAPLKRIFLLFSFFFAAGIAGTNARSLFRSPTVYPSGNYPVAAAIADLNNDGFADIATANVDDKNGSVFLNDGKGNFAPAKSFAVGSGANQVASADLDGDGNGDLVVTDSGSSVYVALGSGDGTFRPAITNNVPNHPRGIAIGDFDGDGVPDLAIAVFGAIQSFDGQR